MILAALTMPQEQTVFIFTVVTQRPQGAHSQTWSSTVPFYSRPLWEKYHFFSEMAAIRLLFSLATISLAALLVLRILLVDSG